MTLPKEIGAEPAELTLPGVRLLSNCRLASRVAGLLSACVGLAVLVGGWVFDIESLRVGVPGFSAMRANAALGLLLLGTALWLDHSGGASGTKRVLVDWFAGMTGLLGVATIVEYSLDMNFGIDRMLLPNSAMLLDAGRMSVWSAAAFMLLSGALFLFDHRRGLVAGQYLALTAGGLGLFNLIGYLYGVTHFYGFSYRAGSGTMAIHTSLSLIILSMGALLSRPDSGLMATIHSQAPGGVMARRLLPAALIIPIVVGWLRWQGQLNGFYDTAFGLALFTAVNIMIFALLIWRSGHILNRLDIERARAERNMGQLADSMPQMVWTANADGNSDYFNKRCYDYNGMTFEQTRDGGWVSAIHPDDRRNVMDLRTRAFAAGEPYTLEYRMKRASDGMYRWHLAQGIPALDSGGKLLHWIGTCTDIHEIKLAEVALRASEASFRQLAESMPHIVWTASPDGNVTYFNRRWYDYTGMTIEQTKNWGWKPVLHPDDLQDTIDRWTHSLTTLKPLDMEYRFKRADGAYRWHLGQAIPIQNAAGVVERWFGACTDIDDYKQAEASIRSLNENLEKTVRERTAELRESEERFRSFVGSIKDYAILMLSPEGRIVSWNASAERIMGYAEDEIIGRNFSCFYSLEGIERGDPTEELRTAAATGHSEEEGWRVRRDGSRFWAEVQITAGHDEAGQLRGFSLVTRDITERWHAQHQLVAERQRAEEANLAKSEFLAAMSHEIRTPMNAMLGMADMLWESQLDADQTRYVEVFRRAGSSLLILINDILDLSKIEAGHLELEQVEFDLEEVVDQAIELTAVKARAKGILLLCRLSPGVATALVGDPNRLKQILINLLGNAVKFTESGEVVLTVRSETGQSGEIEFAISDTGVGIPAEKLDTIFDDFTQGDASITRKYGGTGLGLGISRRLVESMGGRLTAASSDGKGSTFRFTLRFDLALVNNRKVRIELDDLHGKRVLIIDDNETNRLILQETLHAWGLKSEAFGLAQEALASLPEVMTGEQSYSLVLVDSRMPAMDGFKASAEIKRIASELPIVMLTSDVQPGDAVRRRHAGLSGYGVKPLKRADLLRLVCDAINPLKPAAIQTSGSVDQEAPLRNQPRRILVAEDAPDNRLLIQAYMKGSPHRLTFAEDGEAAVDQFGLLDFDLIFMDMQMPVMDGLTATRAIRAIERERGAAPIPIIALTANAGPADVELSRDAGCTAHLSKPISKQKLLSVINECPRQSGTIRVEIPAGLEQIVPGYLSTRRKEVPEMISLLAAADFKGLAVLGHNLKGTGTPYGFPDLSRLGAALEQSAKQADPGLLRAQLCALEDYLDQVQLFSQT